MRHRLVFAQQLALLFGFSTGNSGSDGGFLSPAATGDSLAVSSLAVSSLACAAFWL
nr:hypothetical protein [Ningiella sp. W23]